MKNKILILIIMISSISCKKFLEEPPSKTDNTPVETIENLDHLINGAFFTESPGNYTEVISDDFYLRPKLFKGLFPFFYTNYGYGIISYLLDREYISTSSEANFQGWTFKYKRIAETNLILYYLNKFDGDANFKKRLEAEAKTLRAYFHFLLVLDYCQHPSSKNPNPNKLGLPYRDNFLIVDISKRGTVQETMRRINEDLNSAEKLFTEIGKENFEKNRRWRVNKVSMMAIKSRVALYEGNYQTAYNTSKFVLDKYSSLENLNDDKTTESTYHVDSAKIFDYIDNKGNTVGFYEKQPRSFSNYIIYEENVEFLLQHFISTVYYLNPSDSLCGIYNSKDLRKIKFYNTGALMSFVGGAGLLPNNTFPIDYTECMGSSYRKYPSHIRGPTVPEMMLIKAECIARGINGDETVDAILKKLRDNRFKPGEVPTITWTIENVLKERRRELSFFWRWYDLKRLNAVEGANIWVKKDHYETLLDAGTPIIKDRIQIAPNSNHYALPINVSELHILGWDQNPEPK